MTEIVVYLERTPCNDGTTESSPQCTLTFCQVHPL